MTWIRLIRTVDTRFGLRGGLERELIVENGKNWVRCPKIPPDNPGNWKTLYYDIEPEDFEVIPTRIAVTGTRKGMSDEQFAAVEALLSEYPPGTELHHGCCVGADADFHRIARTLGFYLVGHPGKPLGHTLRAPMRCDEIRDVMPPLERNSVMIAETHILLATPLQIEEQKDGGTWRTLNEARELGGAWRLILRDGQVQTEIEYERPVVPQELELAL